MLRMLEVLLVRGDAACGVVVSIATAWQKSFRGGG